VLKGLDEKGSRPARSTFFFLKGGRDRIPGSDPGLSLAIVIAVLVAGDAVARCYARNTYTPGARALPARTLTLIFIYSPPFLITLFIDKKVSPQTRRRDLMRRRKAARFRRVGFDSTVRHEEARGGSDQCGGDECASIMRLCRVSEILVAHSRTFELPHDCSKSLHCAISHDHDWPTGRLLLEVVGTGSGSGPDRRNMAPSSPSSWMKTQ
jgi:hypothetical protein